MRSGHRLGRQFGWLWGAYGTSALGTWLAFGAFPLIAVQVLHAGPAEVAALASVGAAVGAAVAVPLGPWVEFRRKRPVLIAADLVRCAALLTIPAAFALGVLTFLQLLLVSVVVAAADISFRAASGAYLKTLLPPGPARRQQPVRVHGLDDHDHRASAGRRRDRLPRSDGDGGGRRGQLPALRPGHPRDGRARTAARAAGKHADAGA